jgi:hypothetical protein
VSSFDWFISTGLVPVSFALTGPVAAVFGPRTTLVGAGILGGIVTLGFLFVPGMRDIERTGDLARACREDPDGTLTPIEAPLVPSRAPAPL